MIIAETVVGKGVPFLEGQKSHNMKLPADVAERALEALGAK
jgi:transketolase